MWILGAVPVAFFAVVAAAPLLRSGTPNAAPGVREALLTASVVFGIWVVTGTEVLSDWRRLSPGPVLAWWTVPTAAVGAAAWWSGRRGTTMARLRAAAATPRDGLGYCCVAGVALVLAVTGVVAAVTPPNNFDAHVYHLPRQIYWIEQASVEHYPTSVLRQIMMPPMAEFVGAHLLLLSGADHWANLVQWFSLAMTAVAASLIALELGADMRGQSLAALLVVTNPMAAMQATNPKNDLVLSLWVCTAAYFVLTSWTRPGREPGRSILLGASFGLALLTKGTAVPYVASLVLAAGLALVARQRRRIATGLTIVLVALALDAGHFARNIAEFGSPLASRRVERQMANQTFSPAALASNAVRNLMLHAGTPSKSLNRSLGAAAIRFHRWIGIDPDDRGTTYSITPFAVEHNPFDEDRAPAPLHLVLALAAPVVVWRHRRSRLLVAAALTTAAAYLFFCAAVKWQPFNARLQLPVVSLLAAVAGALVARERPSIVAAVAVAAMLAAAPSILWSKQKPLLGSPSIFTASWEQNTLRTERQLQKPLRCVVAAARRVAPRSVGIIQFGEGREYVVQRAFLRGLEHPPRFVPAASHPEIRPRRLEAADLIVQINGPSPKLRREASGTLYVALQRCDPFTLYVPLEAAAPTVE